MNKPHLHPIPANDTRPDLYSSLEDRQRIDRICADIRRDVLIERVGYVVMFLSAVLIGFALMVGAMGGRF